VNGSQPQSAAVAQTGGTIGGNGTVGTLTVQSLVGSIASTISPGNTNNATGILKTADLFVFNNTTLSTIFEFDLNGTTDYDQLEVNGLVRLSTTTALSTLQVNLGFVPSPGATFTIINNRGSNAVINTFLGLPEGAKFKVGNTTFFISYKGGDGNDVVLHVPEQKEWTGSGGNNNWTTSANWVGGTAPQPGDILLFPGGSARLTNTNDFSSGTVFSQIALTGSGYHLLGNNISIKDGMTDLTGSNSVSIIDFTSIKLDGDQTFNKSNSGFMNIESTIDTNGKTLTINGAAVKTFDRAITGSGGLVINGAGDVQFTGSISTPHTYSGSTVVNSGSFTIFQDVNNSAIQMNGGLIRGNHTVKSITATGGTLQLDNNSAAGLAASADVTLNSAVNVVVALSNISGSPISRGLTVGGAINLGNATLTPSATFNPAPPAGTSLVVVNKTSAGAIQGTFNNMPEGALLPVGVAVLRISYVGGDGNDVTLTVPLSRTWDGGGTTNNWTEAANWVGDVAPGPGDDLEFPAGAARPTNTNDFPAGTTFNSITLSGAGYSLGGNGVALNAGVAETVMSGADNSVNLPIKLNADQTFSTAGPAGRTLIFRGGIDTNAKRLTLDGIASACNFRGQAITGTGGITRTGTSGSVLLANNSYTGGTTISSGLLRIEGSQTSSAVSLAGGRLEGGGTTGPVTASGGTLSPGLGTAGPIFTTSGNLAFNSGVTFESTVQGNAGNRQFGQLNVIGAVNLGGSTLSVIATSPLPAGNTFIIVNNDGTDPVSGTFASLPEGASLTIGGVPFTISYVGGDGGNDVTLTVASTRRWDGGSVVNGNWQTKENWEGDVAPLPGDDLVFPSGAPRLTNSNDFPAGTTFNSITISAPGYLISGNSIALNAGVTSSALGTVPSICVPIKLNSDQTFNASINGAGLAFDNPARIDNNGHQLTLTGPGTITINATDITGSRGLTKSGSGSASIGNFSALPNYAYMGTTTIAGGTLTVNSKQPNSPISLTGGNLINGSGFSPANTTVVGPITATGGTISPWRQRRDRFLQCS
jgi:autotransporter-associated beta strand protein